MCPSPPHTNDYGRVVPEVPQLRRIDHPNRRHPQPLGGESRRGVERQFDAEITEQHPDERVAWKSTGGHVTQAGVVTFHKFSDGTTRVSLQLDWEHEGLVEKVGAVLGIDSASVKSDLENFKKFIEEQGTEQCTEQGAWRGHVSN